MVVDPYANLRKDYRSILNAEEVAEILGLNIRTVYVMAADGRMPASRLPGSRKFHFLLEEIISLLETHKVKPTETPPAQPAATPRKRTTPRKASRKR